LGRAKPSKKVFFSLYLPAEASACAVSTADRSAQAGKKKSGARHAYRQAGKSKNAKKTFLRGGEH